MRVFLALTAAVVVSGLLFLLMNGMIETDAETPVEPTTKRVEPYLHEPRDERVETRPRTLPDPPEKPERPPSDPIDSKPVDRTLTTQEPRDLPGLDGIDGGIDIGGPQSTASGRGDGDAAPVVVVEPKWPREALTEGIEGWVRVEFTIRPDGSVSNPRVIESEPGRLFNQSAIRAVQRWRFRPRMVDGRPVERTATQIIEFRLKDN